MKPVGCSCGTDQLPARMAVAGQSDRHHRHHPRAAGFSALHR
nr:MAG TPA: hypothetical protein [Caudoviricetes sp.]